MHFDTLTEIECNMRLRTTEKHLVPFSMAKSVKKPCPIFVGEGCMCFFISRHVSFDSPLHVRGLALRAIESIRRFYPSSEITVVEDKVHKDLTLEPPDSRVRVVTNPFPGSGEIGTVNVAMNADHDESSSMLIMHDSMILCNHVFHETGSTGVRMLWDFNRYYYHHVSELLFLLSKLAPNSNELADCKDSSKLLMYNKRYNSVVQMLKLYTNPGQWSGCFGISILATKKGLVGLNQLLGILDDSVVSEITTREHRQAMERIFGLYLAIHGSISEPVCGDIFAHPDPWSTESGKMGVEEMHSYLKSRGYDKPIGKSWVGR